MTEEEARDWALDLVGAQRFAMLERFVDLVLAETAQQNLISPATIPAIWSRHVVDSLQLLPLANRSSGAWLDIGTGGGFPGMVLAIAGATPMLMVEPRRKRATFLSECVATLGLADARVAAAKVEQVDWTAAVITARAVASVEKLLLAAAHCATEETRWLLPRGLVDPADLASLAAQHRVVFHVEHSLTQPDSAILILDGRGR
ncbi:ribosomal RNA small subunit methyltransferase G [Sphingomonas metalli]|uniref:Ribosomal RNA small subunit methyltransferase G n=1 Tax=Sphingomonas metalli TaxID=1779358 RepID=A0A916TBN2_9SPHN|nr:16S rRNA (guanine(527)-N(7))-methyltransferase RsmG [Sphingomonas metalli]GGB38775.1 ribosomal RNA small subunit methyltransferase G [Sphingomonas metalli]